MSEALDFSRYAPARRPVLVWDQPEAAHPDELIQTARVIRAACGLIGHCLSVAAGIVRRRLMLRLRILSARLTGSLAAAWTLAGIGWGGFVGFPILFYFMR